MKERYNCILKYEVKIETTSSLCIGSDEVGEILKHPVTGMPFIPATSIAGVFNHYVKKNYKEWEKQYSFIENGGKDRNSLGVFKVSDGSFVKKTMKLEQRDRIKIDGYFGVVGTSDSIEDAGQKFNQELLNKGAQAIFTIEYLCMRENIELAAEIIEQCLIAMKEGKITFGGQSSQGCGRVIPLSVKKYLYDMEQEVERQLYLEEKQPNYEELSLQCLNKMKHERTYLLEGKASQSFLVKKIKKQIIQTKTGERTVDVARNMTNGDGDFMIPASSIKGVFRNHMEKILSIYSISCDKKDKLMEAMFGSQEKMGALVFNDAIIGTQEENQNVTMQNRIRIDPFTGSVFSGSLLYQKPAKGAVQLVVRQRNLKSGYANAITALLLFTFRDIAEQEVIFGGSSSIGKGFLNVESVRMFEEEEIQIIPIIEDNNNKISMYLSALQDEVVRND